jgi:hypothetical protein
MSNYRDEEAGKQDIQNWIREFLPNGGWENFGLISHGSMTHITSPEGEEISQGFHSFERVWYRFGHEAYLVANLGACKYLLKPVVEDGKIVEIKNLTMDGFHSYENFPCHFSLNRYCLIGNLGSAKFLLVPKFKKGQVVEFAVDMSESFHSYQELKGLFGRKDCHMVATSGSVKYLLRPIWEKEKTIGFEHVKDTSDTMKVVNISIGRISVRYVKSKRSSDLKISFRKKSKGFNFDEMNFYV